jgi:ParB-like chromosome segregation protein Spo0J
MDPTHYTLASLTQGVLNSRSAEGQQIRSFQYAIAQLRSNPSVARLAIHKSGSLADETLVRQQALSEVYQRGMNEVAQLLAPVQTRPL